MVRPEDDPRDDDIDYGAVFAAIPGPLLVLTPDLRIAAANADRYAATMTTPASTIGRPLFDLFPDNPDDPAAAGVRNLLASLERVRATLQPDAMPVQKYDIPRPESEGGGFEERYWSPVNTPVVVAGELRYIIHGVVDVTEYVRMRQAGTEQAERAEQLQGEQELMAAEIVARQKEVAEASRQLKEVNAELSELYERSRELDRAKTAFFANVSHELRTPLALILGRAERLLAAGGAAINRSATDSPAAGAPGVGPADELAGVQADAQSIRANAQILLHQVNQMLEAATTESGAATVEWRELDLVPLVRRTVADFESTAAESSIRLRIDLHDPSVPMQGDERRLAGLIGNLVANALKFTPMRGTVRCTVGAGERDVTLEVADSGPGIPEEQRSAVFERFRQLDRGSHRLFGGTGLGLSIVRDVVELHDGNIEVRRAPEGGALFRVTLPRLAPVTATVLPRDRERTAVPTAATALSAQQWIAGRSSRGSRSPDDSADDLPVVLVVEDNADLASFIVDELGSGYRVVHGLDGRDGLDKLAQRRVDLILTDVMMPRMDGIALLEAVKSDPRYEHIPVIVLTARTDPELRVRLLERGAADFLAKPFSPAELRARVDNVADAARMRLLLQARVDQRTGERDEAYRKLAHVVTHDSVTDIPNRLFGVERLAELLVSARSDVGVLIANLDDLQRINDGLGHRAGDTVLATLARRLRDTFDGGCLVARGTGDQFVVGVPVRRGSDELLAVAARIQRDIAIPVRVGDAEVVMTAGIGATLAAGRSDAEVLLREAELAVRRAKATGSDRLAIFDEELQRAAETRLSTETALRRALREGELQLYYQPELDIRTGAVHGFEALLRWIDPHRGIVLPGEVLPVARGAGLMPQIDGFVLRTAAGDCRRWESLLRRTGGRVWINLSADLLRRPDLPDVVLAALSEAGAAPDLLGVEITETLAMDADLWVGHFEALVAAGVGLAIDDFGTGYSSLASLKYFPASVLKLDQSLIAGIGDSDDACSIARAAIEMGHTLGLHVLAEGIETAVQHARLRELRCDIGQGWHLGMPQPAAGH